jgi:hypothetical protein
MTPEQQRAAAVLAATDQTLAAYAEDRARGVRAPLMEVLRGEAEALAPVTRDRVGAGRFLVAATSSLSAAYATACAQGGMAPDMGFLSACDALGRLGEQVVHLERSPACGGGLVPWLPVCAGNPRW